MESGSAATPFSALILSRWFPAEATASRWSGGAKKIEETGNIFEFLRRLGSQYRSVKLPGLPPFTAGAVGYLSYEAVRQLERLPARVEPDVDMDDAIFMYFRTLVAFDHVRHRLFLIANVLTEEDPGNLRQKYDHAVRELDRLERKLARPLRLARISCLRRGAASQAQHDEEAL